MRRPLLIFICFLLATTLSIGIASADQPEPTKEPHGRPTEVGPQGQPVKPAEKDDKGANRHGIFGTVKAISGTSITLTTKQGDVTVAIDSNSKIKIPTKKNATTSDIGTGDRVALNRTQKGNEWVARQIMVVPGKPTVQHRVGIVDSYTENKSITITDMKGGSETFNLTSDTEIRGAKGTDIAKGTRVTVVAGRDPGSDVPTATAIVVQP